MDESIFRYWGKAGEENGGGKAFHLLALLLSCAVVFTGAGKEGPDR